MTETILLPSLGFIFLWPSVGFIVSRIFKRNDVADILWGIGGITLCITWASFHSQPLSFQAKIVLILISLWGLRLGTYLFIRMLGKDEDTRYQKMRKKWGENEPVQAFLKIYALQTVILTIICTPLLWIIQNPFDASHVISESSLGIAEFLGVVLFLVGFILELTADAELFIFKKDPSNHGKHLSEGVWKWSSHPNYLGETLVWWGLFLFAIPLRYGWLTIFSPVLVTTLLLKVSGIPLLRSSLEKKEGYDGEKNFIPVQLRDFLVFGFLFLTFILLDALFLGVAARPFYQSELHELLAKPAQLWAGFLVYLALSFGIYFFCLKKSLFHSGLLGGFFGLTTYCIYEMTNVALVEQWPLKVAMVDILWGTCLGFLTAFFGSAVKRELKE